MGIRLLRGRTFNKYDTPSTTRVAVINESAARKFFPGEGPIGRRVKQGWPESATPWREIVGVVADVKQNGLDTDQLAEIYLPHTQESWGGMVLVARTATPPAGLVSAVRAAIQELDKDIPVYSIRPMSELLSESLAQRKFSMVLLGSFARLALLLAAVGIYGVIAYSVSQRTQEIGIRMALGARRSDVLRMVLREGMIVTAAGIATGVAAALGLTRLMTNMLYGVKNDDPISYALVGALLACVALAACLAPARRAARVDPLVALRCE